MLVKGASGGKGPLWENHYDFLSSITEARWLRRSRRSFQEMFSCENIWFMTRQRLKIIPHNPVTHKLTFGVPRPRRVKTIIMVLTTAQCKICRERIIHIYIYIYVITNPCKLALHLIFVWGLKQTQDSLIHSGNKLFLSVNYTIHNALIIKAAQCNIAIIHLP